MSARRADPASTASRGDRATSARRDGGARTPRRPGRAAWRAAALVGALATASGCRLLVELVEAEETVADVDGGVDGPGADPTCGTWTVAPAGLDACDLPAPGPTLALGAGVWTFDTNSGALTDPDADASFPTSALLTPAGGPEVRVVSVASFALATGAELRVRGRRPLVVAAWSVAELDGHLDATSRLDAPAAGADPDACATAAARPGADHVEGGGGGGGGGAAEVGAPGGTGNDGAAAAGAGGGAAAPPTTPRGGCPGAAGGNALAGAGGAGGGAVVVAARDQLVVGGVITAGGAGGAGSRGGRSGGGGGGGGGLVELASASVVIGAAAVIAANGGGGGGGSDNSPASPGADGQASTTPAAAGGGQGMGAGGGAGGARDAAAAAGLAARRGGGGGGGGHGWITIRGGARDVAPTAVLSPAPLLP